MKNLSLSAAVLCLALIACGPNATTPDASADNASTTPAASSTVSAAERNGVLTALTLRADARGLVTNECGEKVEPAFIPVDVGLGRTILFAIGGGPNMATCYGDGPGLTLLKQSGSGWSQIYSSRGAYMAVLESRHNGAKDLVSAGPGFSHPRYVWNGTGYAGAGEIADEAMGNAAIYPQ